MKEIIGYFRGEGVNAVRIVIGIIISYLMGSILAGPLLASLFRLDLKKKGSGNPGATNAFRVIGPAAGVLVLAADAFKGWGAMRVGAMVGGEPIMPLLGLAAIVGHNWSIFHRFQGGKGIATTLGVVIGLCPKTLLVLVPAFLLTMLGTGFVSVGSLTAAILLPVSLFIFCSPVNTMLMTFGFGAGLMAVYRHWPNVKRLIHGEEHRLFHRSGGKEQS